jgi:hypothetical protein
LALLALLVTLGSAARGQVCEEIVAPPTPLGSPSGCDHCLHSLLPGGHEPHPETRYYIESDLPERLLSTGVLYGSVPVLPPDATGNPPPAMRTQIDAGGFVTIDDDFDVFLWHTSSPGDGSQPRRIVVYVKNNGSGPVMLDPRQVMVTDGGINTMGANLAGRVLSDNWDSPIGPVVLPAGAGEVVAYSKRFAASSNSSDSSANVNCFGQVRVEVTNPDPSAHPTNLAVYVVAIPSAAIAQNKSLAEGLLGTGATSGDPFDLSVPPSGCANRRATGVMESLVWRNDPVTIDAAALAGDGVRYRMAMGAINTQTCPAGKQTIDLLRRPGYVRPDSIGNYMKEYRVTLRLVNTDPLSPRAADVRFTNGTSVGLAWSVATGPTAPADAAVDASPVRTGWAGANLSPVERSLLESDGGPIVLAPCEERYLAVRFVILGNSSLPFDLHVSPEVPTEFIIDDTQDTFETIGAWSAISSGAAYGGAARTIATGGAGSKAIWKIPIVQAGRYDVYARWVAAADRSPVAPYDIRHLGGTTRVLKNQTSSGGSWPLLGSFDFGSGLAGRVTLSDDAPPGKTICADAVRLVYVGSLEEIVDNRDPGCSFVGTWPASANSGFWATDSQIHLGDGGASRATWTADLPYEGLYHVYAWWVPSSNRASAAPYTIHHAGGATTVYADQSNAATLGKWNRLGTFEFPAGGASVVLSADVPTNRYVSADAVRFEFVQGPKLAGDADGDGDVDLADYAAWEACLHGVGATVDGGCAAFDSDSDGDVDLMDFASWATLFTGP